jgi:uncharacterized protein (DUF302 family)
MLGIVILLALIAALMPRMGRLFFVADRSRLPFEETVDRIRERCEASDEWIIQDEKDYNAAYLNRGQGKLPHRLVEFKLGNPDHSYRVNHAAPEVSTFMPAAIAVVELTPDKVVIYRKNTALMGRMFPEPMRSIMGAEVPTQLDALLNEIIG